MFFLIVDLVVTEKEERPVSTLEVDGDAPERNGASFGLAVPWASRGPGKAVIRELSGHRVTFTTRSRGTAEHNRALHPGAR
jgi:hypothetical protein